MQMTAHRPEEFGRSNEGTILATRERPALHHVLQGVAPIDMFDDPVERLQVAQAALAFLDVRLDHVAGIALARMTCITLCQLVSDEVGILAVDRILLELGQHLGRQGLVATDEARIQQGRLDCHILGRQLDTLGRGAECVAHFQPHIPQGVEHVFDDALGMRGGLVGTQEQQIGVGGRRHHAAAISPGCDDGEALRFRRVARAVHMRGGEIIQRVDHFVLHRRDQPGCVQPVSALLQALLRDHAAPEHGAVQMVQRRLPHRLGVPQIIQRSGGQLHPQRAAINDV